MARFYYHAIKHVAKLFETFNPVSEPCVNATSFFAGTARVLYRSLGSFLPAHTVTQVRANCVPVSALPVLRGSFANARRSRRKLVMRFLRPCTARRVA